MTTSRIGRKPVTVPQGVEVKLLDTMISAKGPKGQLSVALHPYVKVEFDGTTLKVHPNTNHGTVITGSKIKLYRAIAGTTRANINNLLIGVSQGFERKLVLVGVGYRAVSKGKVLGLSLGFSHPTDFNVPDGVTIETPTQTEIIIKGADKTLVGKVAAKIRAVRKPEPYKGKGVRYSDEIIELKETKKK